ncbi:phosphopantetheine-binding protein, partial [uncultured Pseudomonas sp.]|uniref:phosphopantetheine-binding protein n=1 Tax=uncultured Pseudomonas sp. TaxID=114707 RepID=UPI0025F97DE2
PRREAGGQANIGRPLANTASYLLDAELHSVPVGVAAELYLAGEGITRGYLLRPGLTAEKFVPNPFSTTGERLYRTGDLTRYRNDGVIEYVGRIDHQVKIRGFRIEMGEIEAQLMAQGSVREAVVLAVEGVSGLQLVGYVVPDQPGLIDADAQADLQDDLKRRLHEVLPAYMVPAQLLLLDYMPLTPNGKLDRKALPAPGAVQRRDQYTPPQTDTEQQLAQIWSEVLNVERVGLEDDFFALGGHSLLATQLIVRIRERMDLQVQLKTLFAASNLRTFSAEVAQLGSASEPLMDELAKSLEALKRLTGDELEKLISE